MDVVVGAKADVSHGGGQAPIQPRCIGGDVIRVCSASVICGVRCA